MPDLGDRVTETLQHEDITQAASILRHMGIQSERALYVIGNYEDRVTIHSQQIRALNLVYSLVVTGMIRAGSKVAVIGGGVSGLTAAIAAARLQASVTVFERQSDVLHLFRGCHTRHLHPNVYDWPSEIALSQRTSLPFLNWSAGTADRIATGLLEEWESNVSRLRIVERTSTRVMIRGFSGTQRRLTVLSPRLEELSFDVIILATGFGLERTIPPLPLRSYWRDDSLHQPELDCTGRKTHYLVSGNGDGGLIDLLRIRLSNFKHETLLGEIENGNLADLKAQLLSIENLARLDALSGGDPGKVLYDAYRRLSVPSELDEHLTRRIRKDTRVTFNYGDWPLSLRSSILHRLLVSRLLAIDPSLDVLPGKVISVDGNEPSLHVRFETDAGIVVETYNRVVLRHGPESPLKIDYPELNARLEPELRPRGALDATRRPSWPDGFFDGPTARGAGTVYPVQPHANDGAVTAGQSEGTAMLVITGAPPASHAGGYAGGANVPTNEGLHSPVSPEALSLRDSLLVDEVSGLEGKVQILSEDDRRFLVRSLSERATNDDQAVRGFGQLLEVIDTEPDLIRSAITSLVKRATFSSSVSYKAIILGLPAAVLRRAEPGVLRAFLSDVFDIVERDRFAEVNVIVPKLVQSQDAIPEELRQRYFLVLLSQAASSSYEGAPAAKQALANLPEPIFQKAVEVIDADLMLRISPSIHAIIRSMLGRHSSLIPHDKGDLINDFINMNHGQFVDKYQPGA